MTAWRQVPGRGAAVDGRRGFDAVGVDRRATASGLVAAWAIDLLAVVVAVAGPFVRTLAIAPSPAPVVVGAAGVVTVTALRWRDDRGWWLGLAAAAAAGLVAAPFGGLVVGVWLSAGIVLAEWAIRGRAPLPRVPAGTDARLPVVALSIVAAYSGRELFARGTPLALVAVAAVITLVIAVTGTAVPKAVRRVAHAAAGGLSFVLFSALGVVTIVLPWIAHRAFAVDPLVTTGDVGWVGRRRLDPRPERPWTVETASTPPTRWTRWRSRMSVPIVGGILVATAVVATALITPVVDDVVTDRPAPFADAPWFDRYRREEQWALFDPGVAFNPLRYPPMLDVTGVHLNIVGGHRVSWTPPTCGCRRVRVWMYGGSTAFGLGQRDGRTIASMIARAAWDDGVAIDISNRGVLGDLGWEGAQRFAWDAAAEDPPDLVIFYDGFNELAAATFRNDVARGGERWPVDWTGEAFQRSTSWFASPLVLPWRVPDGAELDEPPETRLGPVALGRSAVHRYDLGRLAGIAVAQRTGVEAAWFWQPDRYSRGAVSDEPQRDAATERFQRLLRRDVREELPDDVNDLTPTLPPSLGPIFYDDSHTGEEGAALVAAAIYGRLKDRLVAASREGG